MPLPEDLTQLLGALEEKPFTLADDAPGVRRPA